jgi:phosphoribosylanthranilate isomerase
LEDAEHAQQDGADALGFVFEPTSPRYVGHPAWSPAWLKELRPEKVAVFGPAPALLPEGFDAVQATHWPDEVASAGLKRCLAVRLRPGDAPEEIVSLARGMDRIVLDAHQEGAFGGTGRKAPWDLAARIVALAEMPVVLAGGLTPENVGRAVAEVRPWGVDVSSGVERAPGVKDRDRVKAFIEAAKSTD